MSAFEDFVQVELPKRGYLNTDPEQESIIVRRGPGPRQFDAIKLEEGQVLGFVNGQLAPMNLAGAIRKAVLPVVEPAATWVVTHNFGSENAIVQAFDENKSVIFPESITIDDENTITIQFNSLQSGTARIIFLD
jgi:hypothetical protein